LRASSTLKVNYVIGPKGKVLEGPTSMSPTMYSTVEDSAGKKATLMVAEPRAILGGKLSGMRLMKLDLIRTFAIRYACLAPLNVVN
jgi:hypothetical protein